MQTSIKVNYKSTSNAYIAKQWLSKLPDLFSADFEVAIKYTKSDLAHFQSILDDPTSDKLSRIAAKSKLEATALDHPSHCTLTHLSIAWSESDSFVLILDNPSITKVVLNFLTTTEKKQVWHNASYDFKQILYHTGKFPLNYEDTQILAKTLLNHVDVHKATTGLKELAGPQYGNWGIDESNFTLDQIHDPKLIHYAAIDSCATMWIWNRMQSYIKEHNDRTTSEESNNSTPT